MLQWNPPLLSLDGEAIAPTSAKRSDAARLMFMQLGFGVGSRMNILT